MVRKFKLIGWPEIQDLMDLPGFEENSTLVNSNDNLGIYDCTYLVYKPWYYKYN